MIGSDEGLWGPDFAVTGPAGAAIPLEQVGAGTFALGDVRIVYGGDTGLDRYVGSHGLTAPCLDAIRVIDQSRLPCTDLASVPRPLRWFVNTYGRHTPAALFHDFLVRTGDPSLQIPAWMADRCFRFMLRAAGVPRFKRYIMWTAVALRTRATLQPWWHGVLLGLWAILATAGMASFAVGLVAVFRGQTSVLGLAPFGVLAVAGVGPVIASALWGRQWGAGIVTAVTAPWLVPTALVVVVGYAVYALVETVGAAIVPEGSSAAGT